MRKRLTLTVISVFLFQLSYAQFEIPEKPSFQTSVYDYINLLGKSQKQNLESKLIRYSDTTSTQIVVAIISSTQGENIAYLAANWGEKWGIGQQGKDNGILVLLAKEDRNITISTGRGTEGSLTDLMAKRIIESRIIPQFKKGDYYAGLNAGVDGVFEVLTGEFKETRNRSKKSKKTKGWGVFPILFIIILIFIFSNRGGRGGGKGWRRRSAAGTLMDVIILSSLGRSGGGSSGGFGGGGFGSGGFGGGFGGGSFGGGGASGSW